MNNNFNNKNFFYSANSEAYQDAFLTWIFYNFYNDNSNDNSLDQSDIEVKNFSRFMLKNLVPLKNDDEIITEVKPDTQVNDSDIILNITTNKNIKYLVIIEDKTGSSIHPSNKNNGESYQTQLEKYYDKFLNESGNYKEYFEDGRVFLYYYKNEYVNDYEKNVVDSASAACKKILEEHYNNTINEYSNAIITKKEIIKKHSNDILTKEENIKKISNEILKKEENIKSLDEKIKKIEEKIKQKEKAIGTSPAINNSEKIKSLKEQIAKRNSDIDSENNQINKKNIRINVLNSDKNELNTKIDNLNSEINSLNSKIVKLEEERSNVDKYFLGWEIKGINWIQELFEDFKKKNEIEEFDNIILRDYYHSIKFWHNQYEIIEEKVLEEIVLYEDNDPEFLWNEQSPIWNPVFEKLMKEVRGKTPEERFVIKTYNGRYWQLSLASQNNRTCILLDAKHISDSYVTYTLNLRSDVYRDETPWNNNSEARENDRKEIVKVLEEKFGNNNSWEVNKKNKSEKRNVNLLASYTVYTVNRKKTSLQFLIDTWEEVENKLKDIEYTDFNGEKVKVFEK